MYAHVIVDEHTEKFSLGTITITFSLTKIQEWGGGTCIGLGFEFSWYHLYNHLIHEYKVLGKVTSNRQSSF